MKLPPNYIEPAPYRVLMECSILWFTDPSLEIIIALWKCTPAVESYKSASKMYTFEEF